MECALTEMPVVLLFFALWVKSAEMEDVLMITTVVL